MILHSVCMTLLRKTVFPDFMLLPRKEFPLAVLRALVSFMYDVSEWTCRIISDAKILFWNQDAWHNNQESFFTYWSVFSVGVYCCVNNVLRVLIIVRSITRT